MDVSFWNSNIIHYKYIDHFREIKKCFQSLGNDENCRVIVLSGAGKIFCAG